MTTERKAYLEQLSKEEIEVQLAVGSFDIDDLWVLKERYAELRLYMHPLIEKIERAYCRKLVGLSN